jgi:hypothetical protein
MKMRSILLLALLALAGGCAAPAKPEPEVVVRLKPRTGADPVEAWVGALGGTEIRAGDTFAVTVGFAIDPMFEIHDRHAPPPAIATTVELSLPTGFHELGEWSAPSPVQSQWPDGHPVYVGDPAFVRQVRVDKHVKPGEYEIGCAIRYQACNDRYCLPPVSFSLPAEVKVKR